MEEKLVAVQGTELKNLKQDYNIYAQLAELQFEERPSIDYFDANKYSILKSKSQKAYTYYAKNIDKNNESVVICSTNVDDNIACQNYIIFYYKMESKLVCIDKIGSNSIIYNVKTLPHMYKYMRQIYCGTVTQMGDFNTFKTISELCSIQGRSIILESSENDNMFSGDNDASTIVAVTKYDRNYILLPNFNDDCPIPFHNTNILAINKDGEKIELNNSKQLVETLNNIYKKALSNFVEEYNMGITGNLLTH